MSKLPKKIEVNRENAMDAARFICNMRPRPESLRRLANDIIKAAQASNVCAETSNTAQEN